jgi:hypothetical protein
VFTYGNHAMKAYWGVEVYPTIIGLGRRCRWAVSFTSRPLYTRYPLDRRLVGQQIRSGRCGESCLFNKGLLFSIDRFLNVQIRVRFKDSLCGICGEHGGTEAEVSQTALVFPWQFTFHQFYSLSSIIRAGTYGAAIPRD